MIRTPVARVASRGWLRASIAIPKRLYTTEPAKPPKARFGSNNVLVKSIEYVHKVDREQNQLEKTPTEQKVTKLIEVITPQPEMLYLLSLFHYECARMGITRSVDDRRKHWGYMWQHMFRLRPIHDAFWENARLLDLANHKHKLGYGPQDLGLLDPKNFSEDDYSQLQHGVFHGTDFRQVEGVSFTRPWEH
ncbi:hypothetical protein DICA2_F04148 [Diutina catenulata]